MVTRLHDDACETLHNVTFNVYVVVCARVENVQYISIYVPYHELNVQFGTAMITVTTISVLVNWFRLLSKI